MNPRSTEYQRVAKIIAENGYDPSHSNSRRILGSINKEDGNSDYGMAVLFAHTFKRIFHPENFEPNIIPIFEGERDTLIADMPEVLLVAHIITARIFLAQLYKYHEITDMNEDSELFKIVLFP